MFALLGTLLKEGTIQRREGHAIPSRKGKGSGKDNSYGIWCSLLFARRFDVGMPGMRDGVLGQERVVLTILYESSSQLSLDGS